MAILDYVEYGFAIIFANFKNRDAKLFKTTPAFSSVPLPNIDLSAPDCGPSGCTVDKIYTVDGDQRFPQLTWNHPNAVPQESIKEYLVLCEDPDAPLPTPVVHGLFMGIPPSTTRISDADIKVSEKSKIIAGCGTLDNGWRFLPNIRGMHYGGPRPLLGHGPHRYFYTVVALNDKVDIEQMAKNGKISRNSIAQDLVGKIVGWGEWVGVYERKWE